jgi:hypothetical protein
MISHVVIVETRRDEAHDYAQGGTVELESVSGVRLL